MNYLPGDKVTIIASLHGHKYAIGTTCDVLTLESHFSLGLKGKCPGRVKKWYVNLEEVAPKVRLYGHKDPEIWTAVCFIGGKRYGMRYAGFSKTDALFHAQLWAKDLAR